MGSLIDHSGTVAEGLIRSLEDAIRHNPNDAVCPCAILWTDQDAKWQPVIPQLRQMLPQLLTLGEYRPDQRTGPVIWLRSVVDRALPDIEWSEQKMPILYLPYVSRQRLRAVQECPDNLKPLVELPVPRGLLDSKERQGLDSRGISRVQGRRSWPGPCARWRHPTGNASARWRNWLRCQ